MVTDRVFLTNLASEDNIVYVVDGYNQNFPITASCPIIFISSPRNDCFKRWCKQHQSRNFFFPVWNWKEISEYQELCYPAMDTDLVEDRFKHIGGNVRSIFSLEDPLEALEQTLHSVEACLAIRTAGPARDDFPVAHLLLHVIVGDSRDQGYDRDFAYMPTGDSEGGDVYIPSGAVNTMPYQYISLDFASRYIYDQLFIQHYEEMVENLRVLIGGSEPALSRHMFESYGHLVFTRDVGHRLVFRARDLDSNGASYDFTFPGLGNEVVWFDTLPEELQDGKYYRPLSPSFPAVDAFTNKYLFQFTTSVRHTIKGIAMFRKLLNNFTHPILLFVVPEFCFDTFRRQTYEGNANFDNVRKIVVRLPIAPTVSGKRPRR